MINISNLPKEAPYLFFKEKYDQALSASQKNIEVITISSYDMTLNEVNSRCVNLKYIDQYNFIFFSNYNSPKSLAFKTHNQVAVLIYWNSINVQIRMKAKILRTSEDYNQTYFIKRNIKKNALAISSQQSQDISSYDAVKEKYKRVLKNDNLIQCPDYWGGFSFTPYYFEFWKGHKSRINKREAYEKTDGIWKHSFLQP